MNALITKSQHVLEMIKFSHSIFALPFALASLIMAANGIPDSKILLLVIVAMVLARNTAMAFNRLVDVDIDKKNPRTASRHLPSGLLSKGFVTTFIIINAALFIGVSYFLNPLTFKLSPVALFIICFYSLTKRFTKLTQIFLGMALGISPVAAWIALRGHVELPPVFLGLAVMFWVAGFDIIYATQDYEHDRQNGVHSLVVMLGIPKALLLSRFFHLICLLFFFQVGWALQTGLVYFVTVILMGLFLAFEHSLVKPHDLSRVNAAFFTMNGLVGIAFLVGVIGEYLF